MPCHLPSDSPNHSLQTDPPSLRSGVTRRDKLAYDSVATSERSLSSNVRLPEIREFRSFGGDMRTTILILFTILSLCLPGVTFSQSHLSSQDRELIELMKDQGLIPQHMNEKQITDEYLDYLKLMLKEEWGVDDIDSIGNPDPKFLSPEKTWSVYKNAMIRGDFESAYRCLMPKYKKKLRSIVKAVGEKKMSEKAKEMNPIEKVVSDENSAKYRLIRSIKGKDITFYVYFINVFGEWKIDQY